MRNINAMGLALLAMLATSAVAATAASADDKLTAESYPVTLTGGVDPGSNVQWVLGMNVNCSQVQDHGSLSSTATTFSVSAVFSGCLGAGLQTTIHMNGCTFLYHLVAGDTTHGTVDIVCPAGQEITFTINPAEHGLTNKCTIHVKPQTGLGEVTFTNVGVGATRELTFHLNLKKIHYVKTEGTGLGRCTSGTGTDGTLTTTTVLTGENASGTHIALYMSKV
ncbi:MAG TPA: hypothetical protein VI669_02210 [Vicinamibacteria bacterium]